MKAAAAAVTLALMLVAPARAAPAFPPLEAGVGFADCGAAAVPICRVRRDLSEAEARMRLDGRKLALWAEGDTFNVVLVDDRAEVHLCCAIQAPLARLPGTDLWTLTLRIPELRKAVLDAIIIRPGAYEPPAEWRGPEAPPKAAQSNPLKGKVESRDLASKALGETRKLEVYLPPGYRPGGRYPVAYMADGEGLVPYAWTIEPLILSGRIPPVILVGLPSGQSDDRARDYLLGRPEGADAGFVRHEAFFLEEVMPWAEQTYGASTRPQERLLIGQSNGAAWAVATALRHPELFGHAAGLSFGWRPAADALGAAEKPRLFLAAGTLEGRFHLRTTELAQKARTAGYDVTLLTPVSGHSPMMWDDLRPQAFAWAFGRR